MYRENPSGEAPADVWRTFYTARTMRAAAGASEGRNAYRNVSIWNRSRDTYRPATRT